MLAWGYVIHFLRTIIMSNSLLGASLQNMTEFVKQNKQTNHIYYKIPFHKTGWSWERVRRSGFNPSPPFIRPVGYFNYFPATKILPTTGSHAIVRCEQKKSLIALKNVLGRRVNKISWISGFKLGLPPAPLSNLSMPKIPGSTLAKIEMKVCYLFSCTSTQDAFDIANLCNTRNACQLCPYIVLFTSSPELKSVLEPIGLCTLSLSRFP